MIDKQSFVKFVAALREDLRTNPDAWESETLADYLLAVERWANDWRKFERTPHPWRHAAQIFRAARTYE